MIAESAEVVIYTAIVGNYDALSRPKKDHTKDGVAYICFSDDIVVAPAPWKLYSLSEVLKSIGREDILDNEPRRISRFFKFNPSIFFNCSTLWVDGNARVLGDPRGMISAMEFDLGFFLHPKRRLLSHETRYARRKSRDRSLVDKQAKDYLTNLKIPDAIVYAGGIIASRRSQESDELLAEIWKEYQEHSDRDQLAISKIVHLSSYSVSLLPGRITNNKYAAVYHGHRPTAIKTKLEIGKRGRGKNEWMNLDIKGADILGSVPPLPERVHSQKWQIIKAIHFWEHLYLWEARKLARECYEVLAPGGRLILECPNIVSAAKGLLGKGKGGDKYIWHVLFGNPNYEDPSYGHKWGYTPETLKQQLIEYGGFKEELVEIHKARFHVPERDFRIIATKE